MRNIRRYVTQTHNGFDELSDVSRVLGWYTPSITTWGVIMSTIKKLFVRFINAQQRAANKRIEREFLHRLTDRQLRDIGLDRFNINRL